MLICKPSHIEVMEFIGSLTDVELKYYDIRQEKHIKSALLLNGCKKDGELIGIGGVMEYYHLIPHTFYMIKKEYQGKGLGSLFSILNMSYAANNLSFIITIIERGNTSALKIAKRQGFKLALKHGNHLCCFRSFNNWGKVVGWFFPIIVSTYYLVKRR